MKTKKIVVLLLALLMVWAVLPPQGTAAAGEPDIVLGTSKLSVGNTVWFGNYNNAPVHWRVMGNGNDLTGGNPASRLFLSDRVLDKTMFNPAATNDVWQGSVAQSWCQSFYDGNTFSAGEKSALIATSKNDAAYEGKHTFYGATYGTSLLANEHVFFLSAEEAETIYFSYDDDNSRIAYNLNGIESPWWLRSPHVNPLTASEVDTDGWVYFQGISSVDGARPAFNLNVDAASSPVLFTSAAVGGKPSTVGLAEIVSGAGTEWKLTLSDSNHSGFSASAGDGAILSRTAGYTDWIIPVSYSGAVTGTNEKISAMICKDGTALYYGQLADAADGAQSINVSIPTGLTSGTYQLKLFNEQVNGDKQTDYASAFSDITFRVNRPAIMPDMGQIGVGDTVWFGNYSTSEYEPLEPVLWRVMGEGNNSGGNSKLLLSDRLLDSTSFYHAGFYNNQWQGSLAQTWCTGFFTNALSEVEKTVLISTSKSDAAYTGKYESFGTSSLIDEHVFFLSAEEAESIYFPYDDDSSRIAKELDDSNWTWWLRSPLNVGNDDAGIVDMDGKVSYQPTNYSGDARPAFNLDLDPYTTHLLLVSPAVGGKVSGPLGADALTTVPDTDTTEWKLTLRDDSRNFEITWAVVTSKKFIFEYVNAPVGQNEYISAILTGGGCQPISYYGRIAQPTASSGRLTIHFPVEAADGTSCLFVFSEQCNGDKQTDYALGSEISRYEPNAFDVTSTLTNMTTDDGDGYLYNDFDWETGYVAKYDYSANLAADSGYLLPEDIIVKVGETTLTKGAGYDYNSTSGALLIHKEYINEDIEIVANGVPVVYDVTVQTEGSGTAYATPSSATMGTQIALTATPATGWKFKEWQTVSGDITISDSYTFTMPNSNVTVKAVFEAIVYDVTVQTEGSGTAYATPSSGTMGTQIALTATPATGWKFKEWRNVSGNITFSDSYKFTMPSSNVTVKAVFEPIQADITFDPSGGKWEDETTAPKVITANVGDEITIIGAPTREGYEFRHWQGSVHHPGETYQVPIGGHTFTAVWRKITPTEPTETEPTETEPTETEPTETEPTETEPTESKPTESEPTEPGNTEPGETEPTEPGDAEPTEPDDTLPTTGENFRIHLWLILLLVVAGGLLLFFNKKKLSRQKD